MVIYIDVLFLINLYVTYFELMAAARLIHARLSDVRKILAAAVGGLFSFVVFLPADMLLLNTVIKLAACTVIAFIGFGYGGLGVFLKKLLFFLLVNFIFAGLMLALWLFAAPLDMQYINATPYFDIDFFTILLCTAVSYGVVAIIRLVLDKNGRTDKKYTVRITNNGNQCELSALCDSGNGLVDYFSGLPVIICKRSACADISPPVLDEIFLRTDSDGLTEAVAKGVRVLPFRTIEKGGLVYVFKADSITICEEEQGTACRVNALIGVTKADNGEYEAIFNPKILL